MRKQCPNAPFFVMRPILVFLDPKAGKAFLNPEKPPSGPGEGVRFSLHRGPPGALYTGYGRDTYLTT